MNNRYAVFFKTSVFHPRTALPAAAGIVLILWFIYTGLQALILTGKIAPPLSTGLELIPGVLGVAALLAAGFSRQECFLRIASLSRKGLLALLVTVPLLLPVFITGEWGGWAAQSVLVYAPATAISQELFFRCALLPLFLRVLKGRPTLAICLAALLFGLWHIGPLVQGLAWGIVLPVMMVPFLCGLAWSGQVRHDRTVLWVTIYHILIDQGMALFTWG